MSLLRSKVTSRRFSFGNVVGLFVLEDHASKAHSRAVSVPRRALSHLLESSLPSCCCSGVTRRQRRTFYTTTDSARPPVSSLSSLPIINRPSLATVGATTSDLTLARKYSIPTNSRKPTEKSTDNKHSLDSEHQVSEHRINDVRTSDQEQSVSRDGSKAKEESSLDDEQKSQAGESTGVLSRFKAAYKQYGKILVAVHVATSCVWYGSFYYAVRSGLDIVPFMERMGASETVIAPFRATGIGDFAVAYLLYKVATPARYTVTIVGTQQAAKYLRKTGYLKPIPEGDSIRSLMKESRTEIQSKYVEKKEEMKERVDDMREDMKERLKDRADEMRDQVKDRAEDLRDRMKDRADGMRDTLLDRKGEMKDIMKDRTDEFRDKIRDRADDLRDKVKDRTDELKDRAREVHGEIRDRVLDQTKGRKSERKEG